MRMIKERRAKHLREGDHEPIDTMRCSIICNDLSRSSRNQSHSGSRALRNLGSGRVDHSSRVTRRNVADRPSPRSNECRNRRLPDRRWKDREASSQPDCSLPIDRVPVGQTPIFIGIRPASGPRRHYRASRSNTGRSDAPRRPAFPLRRGRYPAARRSDRW